MADFITNEVLLDRHGRSDGWFIEPAGARAAERDAKYAAMQEVRRLAAEHQGVQR